MLTPYPDTAIKTSHELAEKMQQIVNYLLAKASFQMQSGVYLNSQGKINFTFYDKKEFIEAVKALGSGVKMYINEELIFSSMWSPVTVSISRDRVCKKIVTYDCEPMFTPEEVETI